MNRAALLAFAISAALVVVLVIDLAAQWTHYKRTAVVLAALAVATAGYGVVNRGKQSAS